jgi:hypothetical protein
MKNRLLLLLSISSQFALAQQWEWVKSIKGAYIHHADQSIFTDNEGSLYMWCGTANQSLQSDNYSINSPVYVIAKYSSNGAFLWYRTFDELTDVDVSESGRIWAIAGSTLLAVDKNGQTLFSTGMSEPALRIKAGEHAAVVVHWGKLDMYDNNGTILHTKNTPLVEKVIKVTDDKIFYIGTYYGDSVYIDNILLPSSGKYYSAKYYAVLDKELKAIHATQTSGCYMYNLTTAYVTTDEYYIHGANDRYVPADLFFNDAGNNKIWNKQLGAYLNNRIASVTEHNGQVLCTHSSLGGGPGCSTALCRFTKTGDSVSTLRWEGIYGYGVATSSTGIFLSGLVYDTTSLDNYHLDPSADQTVFIGKLGVRTTVSVPLEKKSNTNIYPVPFISECSIDDPDYSGGEVAVHLTDATGKKLPVRFYTRQNKITILRDNLPRGVYHCIVQAADRFIYNGKLLVSE